MRRAWRAALIALLLINCNRPDAGGLAVDSDDGAECSRPIGVPQNRIDVLFVIDDSALMGGLQSRLQAEIGRIVDEQMSLDRNDDAIWYHFGVVSADPAQGARLRGGDVGVSKRIYI